MQLQRNFLLVFSGPPCSGKSYLAARLSSELGVLHLEMDRIGARVMPQYDGGETQRLVAYRTMHLMAEMLVARGRSVIVDATYAPAIQRRAIEEVAAKSEARLFVVECQISVRTAEERFRTRTGHPAADLTVESIRQKVVGYPFGANLPSLCVVDTELPEGECLTKIKAHLFSGQPLPLGIWSAQGRHVAEVPTVSQQSTTVVLETAGREPALSEQAVALARRNLFRLRVLAIAQVFVITLALVTVVLKVALTAFSIGFGSGFWTEFARFIGRHHFLDFVPLGTWFLALAGVWAGIWALKQYAKQQTEEVNRILASCRMPRYTIGRALLTTDVAIFQAYWERTEDKTGFALPNVPLYFVVPPVHDGTFDVTMRLCNTPFEGSHLIADSTNWGFDWYNFCRWRLNDNATKYHKPETRTATRCIEIGREGSTLIASVTECRQEDYVCTEMSVDLSVAEAGVDLRELIEGERWENHNLQLTDLSESAKRYSMRISTTILLTTQDKRVLLRRLSRRGFDGHQSLGATASGFVDWRRDVDRIRSNWIQLRHLRFGDPSLRLSALNQLKRETGVPMDEVDEDDAPFLAAAFNLRHGRDLSFYVHFNSKLTATAIAQRWAHTVDWWRLSSITFVPVDSISENGSLSGRFQVLSPALNRHLRGALYAFAVSGRRDRVLAGFD